VDYQEEGSAWAATPRSMSEGFQKAQRECSLKQAKDADIIITTALIPRQTGAAPDTAEMVQS